MLATALELAQQAEAAGLRFVPCGGGFGLAIVGEDGLTVGQPLPMLDAYHAAIVIGSTQAVRAELAALAAIGVAQAQAKRSTKGRA